MVKISRNTKQKELIEKESLKMGSFFSAEELFNRLKNKDREIGIATVYRFLRDSVNKNKIHAYTCDRRKIYSLKKTSHCHFICEKTGRVIHFELDNLDFLKYIKGKIPGTINSISIEVSGVCDECGG